MRLLVCGGRDYADKWRVIDELDRIQSARSPILVVIHGCATGADLHAEMWAESRKRKALGFRAEWQKHGKKAGPLRNQRMIDEGKPDLVVAFPGGKGTADLVSRAHQAGIEVIEVKP